jgi:hypothetical protein
MGNSAAQDPSGKDAAFGTREAPAMRRTCFRFARLWRNNVSQEVWDAAKGGTGEDP